VQTSVTQSQRCYVEIDPTLSPQSATKKNHTTLHSGIAVLIHLAISPLHCIIDKNLDWDVSVGNWPQDERYG
jgi:hypothetical protein